MGGNKTWAIILIQKSTSLDTCICWQSIKATESSPLNFLAIEAGKHAFKSFVAVNVIDNMYILSITFTATKDLNACFPASIARKFNGLDSVAFIDCQQMHVSNDVDFCIRIMAQVLLPPNYSIKHPYLRGAAKLRTDRC